MSMDPRQDENSGPDTTPGSRRNDLTLGSSSNLSKTNTRADEFSYCPQVVMNAANLSLLVSLSSFSFSRSTRTEYSCATSL